MPVRTSDMGARADEERSTRVLLLLTRIHTHDGSRLRSCFPAGMLFSEIVEQRFDLVRNHILRLKQEAKAERA